VVPGQPWQKFSKTPSQPIKLGVVVHAGHPRSAGSINRRMEVHIRLGKNVRPDLRNKVKKQKD
jgi:hypothetical protein